MRELPKWIRFRGYTGSDTVFRQESEKDYLLTLRIWLQHILAVAVSRYGKRYGPWIISDIRFHDDVPCVWYPHPKGSYKVVVKIGNLCRENLSRACFQMAHESIHLLSPSGRRDGTVLEEGLADIYSSAYMQEYFNEWRWRSADVRLELASGRVRQFLSSYPDAIRVLRRREPMLSRITADLIKETYPDIDPDFAKALTLPFPYEENA